MSPGVAVHPGPVRLASRELNTARDSGAHFSLSALGKKTIAAPTVLRAKPVTSARYWASAISEREVEAKLLRDTRYNVRCSG